MGRRGPKKPAREMTTEEAAERLFGKRVMRRVQQELEELEGSETPEELDDQESIEDEDR